MGVAISVGGWHDPPRKAGLAHLLEHMLFGGTQRWNKTQGEAALAQRAIYFNGITGPERTFYWLALPAEEVEFGFRYLRQLVFQPAWPLELLDWEKERIFSEALGIGIGPAWAWRLENWWMPWFLEYQRGPRFLTWNLLKGTNLDQPVIGFTQTRKSITLDELKVFYQQHYTADRAAVLVVGEIAPERVKALVENFFGDLKPSPEPQAHFSPPPTAGLPRRYLSRADINDAVRFINLGYRWLNLTPTDLPALYLAQELILYEINRRLEREKIPYALNHILHLYQNFCLFTLGLQINRRDFARIERELPALLERLRTGQVNWQSLPRVRQLSRKKWLMDTESASNHLLWLAAHPAIFTEIPPPVMSQVAESIPAEAVQALLARLLDPAQCMFIVHQPYSPWFVLLVCAILVALILLCFRIGAAF